MKNDNKKAMFVFTSHKSLNRFRLYYSLFLGCVGGGSCSIGLGGVWGTFGALGFGLLCFGGSYLVSYLVLTKKRVRIQEDEASTIV